MSCVSNSNARSKGVMYEDSCRTNEDMKVAWGQLVTDEFLARLWRTVQKFGWPQEYMSYMMACMAFETGTSFAPDQKNGAGSGATGLIQFMPVTAMQLGTTCDLLAAMTAVEQLDYVEKYFEPYKDKIKGMEDMYTAILAPKYVGLPSLTVLYSEGAAYRMNAPLDRDSDGKITKAEAAYFVQQSLWKGLQPKYSREWEPLPSKIDSVQDILNELDVLLTRLKEKLDVR